MTFSYTDEQLNNLNRDYAVYSVNLEFAKRNGRTYVNSNLIESISPDDLEKNQHHNYLRWSRIPCRGD